MDAVQDQIQDVVAKWVVKGVPCSSNLNLEGGAQKSMNWDLVYDLCCSIRDRVRKNVYVGPSPGRCQ